MLACYLVSDILVLPHYLVMQLFRLECRNVCLIEGSFGFPFFDSELRTGLGRFSRARQIFMLYRVYSTRRCHEKEWQ